MRIINSIYELKKEISLIKNSTIGFIPTMGALHEGHLSLIKKSKEKSDITVCSIFVNKQQFNKSEDFKNYPNTVEKDVKMLEKENCDILFLPSSEEMYGNKPTISFQFGNLEATMEGSFRPGHFSGVALIVSKLFNIVNPDYAFFGQKDFQQLAIVKTLVKDLNFDIKIIPVETKREKSGLAMSSRNERLNKDEKREASKIYKSLLMAKEELNQLSIPEIKNKINNFYSNSNLKLEYFEIVDSISLEEVIKYDKAQGINICIAVQIGNVRLIDNINL